MTYQFLVLSDATPAPAAVIASPDLGALRPQDTHVEPAAPMRFRRKAHRGHEPLKLQIFKLLLLRNMAIGDLVAHFKATHCQSKVYGAVSTLRCCGQIHVVCRELRKRSNGSPMCRDVYGPTLATREMQL